MFILRLVLSTALDIFSLFMWARFILDWATVLAPSWKPRGPMLVIAELIYAVTDPPLKLVRRVVPPVRIGAVSLDIAWMIVMLLIAVLQGLIPFIR